MVTMDNRDVLSQRLVRICLAVVAFLAAAVGVFFLLELLPAEAIGGSKLSRAVFQLGSGVLLATLMLCWLAALRQKRPSITRWWACPAMAAGLALCIMCLSYAYLGVWPLGEKSVMLVDMHHQYAPMLSELRNMLLHGGSAAYSTNMGLGTNFIPAFAYYLASPLNLLLVLFPEAYLTEAILVLTLLKFALAAGAFAACVQGLYCRRDAGVVALALLYASSGYMLAYSWNIMWLDAVLLLPLAVLALERLLSGKSLWPYTLVLALTLFASYYIGFMVCVFLVLVFLLWLLRQRRTGREILQGTGRFALASALAGGLAACLLLPTALALGRTSAANGSLGEFTVNFPLFDLLNRFFFGATPTVRSGNLPNVYCGVVAVLLLPIYMSAKTILLRRRLTYGGLLTVLLISCTVEPLDLVWHGLHAPNDLPYRFSFLLCFVLVLLAARVLEELPRLESKTILASLGGCAVYLLLSEKLAETPKAGEPDRAWLLYVNLLLLVVYTALLFVMKKNPLSLRAGSWLLLMAVVAELLLGNGMSLTAMDKQEHFTQHSAYADQAVHRANAAAVERTRELARAAGQENCRIEFLPRQTCMDTALHHYRGLTTFASSNPHATTILMGELGYAVNGVNSYQYHTFYSPTDSLFGLRYVILGVRLSSHPQLKLVDVVTVEGEYRYIYENTQSLPIAYCVDNAIRQYEGMEYDPFSAQEELYGAMMGRHGSLFTRLDLETDSPAGTCHGSAFTKHATGDRVDYTARVQVAGQHYVYVDCRAAESLSVEVHTAEGAVQNTWSVTTYEPYIIDLGWLEVGQTVRTHVTGSGGFTGHAYVVRPDEEAIASRLQELSAGGMEVTLWEADRISGTVTTADGQALLVSLPYDTGWQVTVDGEPAEIFPVDVTKEGEDGALLGVQLTPGKHTLELRYQPPGAMLGWSITLISALVLAGIVLWPKYGKRIIKKLHR